MEGAAFLHERLGELGELRVYRRPGPPEHVAFEVLREADGRAWTLRVPWTARAALRGLLTETASSLNAGAEPAFDEQGCAELAKVGIGRGDEVLAVMLEQGSERAFAVWRRELIRSGWNWTLDVVVTPEPLAAALCERMLKGLDQLDQPARRSGSTSASDPIMPTPSQPPRAMTRSISRR